MATTPKRPGDRLRRHADNLRSGRLTWVPGCPATKHEACMVVGGGWWSNYIEEIAMNAVVRDRGSSSATSFNATHSLPEVLSAIEAAADRLDRLADGAVFHGTACGDDE